MNPYILLWVSIVAIFFAVLSFKNHLLFLGRNGQEAEARIVNISTNQYCSKRSGQCTAFLLNIEFLNSNNEPIQTIINGDRVDGYQQPTTRSKYKQNDMVPILFNPQNMKDAALKGQITRAWIGLISFIAAASVSLYFFYRKITRRNNN